MRAATVETLRRTENLQRLRSGALSRRIGQEMWGELKAYGTGEAIPKEVNHNGATVLRKCEPCVPTGFDPRFPYHIRLSTREGRDLGWFNTRFIRIFGPPNPRKARRYAWKPATIHRPTAVQSSHACA